METRTIMADGCAILCRGLILRRIMGAAEYLLIGHDAYGRDEGAPRLANPADIAIQSVHRGASGQMIH